VGLPSDFWAQLTPEERYGQEIPPPVSEVDLRQWESEHGIVLPTTLAQALLTQDGGIVWSAGVNLVFASLYEFLPLSDDRWIHVEDEEEGRLVADRSKHFVIGEYQGCSIVLDYNVGPEPRVMSIWHGFCDELREEEGGGFDKFLQVVWDTHAQEERDREENQNGKFS
jgi:hypothetical protein